MAITKSDDPQSTSSNKDTQDRESLAKTETKSQMIKRLISRGGLSIEKARILAENGDYGPIIEEAGRRANIALQVLSEGRIRACPQSEIYPEARPEKREQD